MSTPATRRPSTPHATTASMSRCPRRRRRRQLTRLLLRDLEQVATPASAAGGSPRRGRALGSVVVVDDAYVLCDGDAVEAVGRMRDLPGLAGDVDEIDGRGL